MCLIHPHPDLPSPSRRFPALRSIVVCFLEAVPLLVSVVGMLVFFLFIFAVTGTELFAGDYHRVCVDDATGRPEASATYDGEFGCGARRCPAGFACARVEGAGGAPSAGFDNVGFALLTVFQAMTLSGWSFIMYRAMDAVGGYAVAYFAPLVVFGTYFVVRGCGCGCDDGAAAAAAVAPAACRLRRRVGGYVYTERCRAAASLASPQPTTHSHSHPQNTTDRSSTSSLPCSRSSLPRRRGC